VKETPMNVITVHSKHHDQVSALVGVSVSVPVRHGRMALGQFQRIVLLEFEGPRERAVSVTTAQELA
jgi:thiamine phosphate synthase YjbQ (UPF0047 family)